MKNVDEEKKVLASYAVFRELYDNKKDVFDIIGEFLKERIVSESKYQFTSTDITKLLNSHYEFTIPEAIVVTALRRFKSSYVLQDGMYTIERREDFEITDDLNKKCLVIKQECDNITNNLFSFIEEKKNNSLSSEEKKNIKYSLYSFLLDENVDREYSKYVSAFIIKNKQNGSFQRRLNTIKEGVVLYTGLTYTIKPNEIWRRNIEMVIYLDTEILFDFAGYNGLIYKELFYDFFNLVKEINKTHSINLGSGKSLIQLMYFEEVEEEVEKFFKKAEEIVDGNVPPNPGKTAMSEIINGCNSCSDVVEKKAKFYAFLRENKIGKDTYSYYREELHKYNIESQELLEKMCQNGKKAGHEELVLKNIKFLNFVNIRRRGNSNNGFEQIGHVFLTRTVKALTIAKELQKSEEKNGYVPLALSPDFMTNKFWFKLNKGFGDGEYPKTFDVISKAKIILSSQVNNSVSEQFESLNEKFRNKELTKEQAVSATTELRKKLKNPEEIGTENFEDILESIDKKDIESYLKEQDYLKHKVGEAEKEKERLREEVERANTERQESEKKKIELEQELDKYHRKEEEDILKKVQRRKKCKRICKCVLYIIISIVVFLVVRIMFNLFFNMDEKTKNTVGVFLSALSMFFPIVPILKKIWHHVKNLFRV